MSLFRTRKSAQWHIKLRSKDGVWVQRSCGTRDSRTARRINDTIDALGNAAARAWDLLDLVVDGSLSVAALFDVYALADGDLARVRAHLNDIDVAPLVDAWYEAMQAPAQGVSLDTAKHYRSAVRSMIPAKRPFTRSALTRRSVERWIAAMTCAPGTVRKRVAGLRAFTEWLVQQGVLAACPVDRIALPPQGKPRDRWLTTPQLLALAEQKPEVYGDLDLVLAGTAIDLSTSLQLRRRDITAAKMEIRARGTKTYTRDRVVLVAQFAHEAVRRWCEGLGDNARVFHEIPDRWIAGDVHRLAVQALVAEGRTEYEGFWLRDHRLSWAVRMAKAGAPMRIISEGLGHANEALVSRIYGRYQPTSRERLAWEQRAADLDREREK
jgi:integrase